MNAQSMLNRSFLNDIRLLVNIWMKFGNWLSAAPDFVKNSCTEFTIASSARLKFYGFIAKRDRFIFMRRKFCKMFGKLEFSKKLIRLLTMQCFVTFLFMNSSRKVATFMFCVYRQLEFTVLNC